MGGEPPIEFRDKVLHLQKPHLEPVGDTYRFSMLVDQGSDRNDDIEF